jgi:ribosomal protein L31E
MGLFSVIRNHELRNAKISSIYLEESINASVYRSGDNNIGL